MTHVALAVVVAFSAGCDAPRPSRARDAGPARADGTLPSAIAGFTSGPIERGPEFERRSYARGSAHVTVTLGRLANMDEAAYGEWVRQSAAYPQAALDVPPGGGNGFYECGDDPAAGGCALLIQLRAGAHLEIRGDGRSTRADVDAVARGLPLRALASAR